MTVYVVDLEGILEGYESTTGTIRDDTGLTIDVQAIRTYLRPTNDFKEVSEIGMIINLESQEKILRLLDFIESLKKGAEIKFDGGLMYDAPWVGKRIACRIFGQHLDAPDHWTSYNIRGTLEFSDKAYNMRYSIGATQSPRFSLSLKA